MKLDSNRHVIASLYVVFVCPLLIFTPIIQALERWRTWEQIAWATAVAVGFWCWWNVRDIERRL